MLKRMLLSLGVLGLAGCTSNGNVLNEGVALMLKLLIIATFLVAVAAAFSAILIKDSSERRVTAGLVALVGVIVAALFVLVLVA